MRQFPNLLKTTYATTTTALVYYTMHDVFVDVRRTTTTYYHNGTKCFFEDVFLLWVAPGISRDIGFKLWLHEYLVKS